jgi:hypothetical protein
MTTPETLPPPNPAMTLRIAILPFNECLERVMNRHLTIITIQTFPTAICSLLHIRVAELLLSPGNYSAALPKSTGQMLGIPEIVRM